MRRSTGGCCVSSNRTRAARSWQLLPDASDGRREWNTFDGSGTSLRVQAAPVVRVTTELTPHDPFGRRRMSAITPRSRRAVPTSSGPGLQPLGRGCGAASSQVFCRVKSRRPRGNPEGTPAWARASTRGHSFSLDLFGLRDFRARRFPCLPSVPASELNSKEGVGGSSPSEGFAKAL
jgi:hypothetical protein